MPVTTSFAFVAIVDCDQTAENVVLSVIHNICLVERLHFRASQKL